MKKENQTAHIVNIHRTRTGLGFPQSAALVKKAVNAALAAEGVETPCSVDVTFTDNDSIHELNLRFRQVDRPTDVLSFPVNELSPGAFAPDECEYDCELDASALGDMVLSLEQCAGQAREFGHSYARELQYLTVHSVLHLLGYDHVDEGEDKRLMRTREKEIMSVLRPGEDD
ncbi:MAG: rRNA maturation RNase YbeY [Oscillospiraceae bacterium]|nr:rRNA maturation RNase YbeY [Oscillospiraceae bacterium]